MFLVAVTGGIATGKSTVTKIFKDNGVQVVDADLIARQVVEIDQPAYREIVEVFGNDVLKENGEINREILGKMIFNDRELRGKLNQITHPRIHRTILLQVLQNFVTGKNYIVLDLPLLFETGILIDFIYKIITVSCTDELQIKRLMERSGLNKEDARKRIESQMPLEKKCEKSNFVIENSGDFESTEKEVLKILSVLNSSKHHWRIRTYLLIGCSAILLLLFWLNYVFQIIPINWS